MDAKTNRDHLPSVRILLTTLTLILAVARCAQAIDVTSCGQAIPTAASAVLTADLDCTGASGLVLGARARLDLAGHTLSGDSFAGIACLGACSVVGPGAVTGFNVGVDAESGSVKADGVDFATHAIGIVSQRTVQAKNATFTGHQNSAIEARQAVKVENCTFAGNGNAVSSSSTVKLTSSTITGGAFGLNTRGANLIDSTIDTTTDGGNGPDIVTLSRPRLVRSTCAGTSKRRYDPVASWGVCALD